MQYSQDQIKAITHRDGPAIVVAGPGSGKTAVLIERIKFLITTKQVLPERILVITFSKAAVVELQSRFSLKCSDVYYPVTFGTFHSIFFHILHQELQFNTSNIASLNKRRRGLRDAIKYLDIQDYPTNELIDSLLKSISLYKNSGLSIIPDTDCNINEEKFIQIFESYDYMMRCERLIDFDDMLLLTYDLLSKDVGVRKKYSCMWDYIMIDEFQDINPIQFKVVRMLSNNNLWICGDDDQSLYMFRFGAPELMINFTDYYPEAKKYILSTNYRSTEEIIEAANRVIGDNKVRIQKRIIGTKRVGEKVSIISHPSVESENTWLIKLIAEVANDNELEETVILCRTNLEASNIARLIKANGYRCEYMLADACNSKQRFVNDYIHYIKLAESFPKLELEDFFPVMNKPARYLSRKNIGNKNVTLEELYIYYSDKKYMKPILDNLQYQLIKLNSLSDLYSKINYIRKGIGYDAYMKEYYAKNIEDYNEYISCADFIQALSKNVTLEMLVHDFENADMEDNKNSNIGVNAVVNIMTYHASKGLEFKNVIIPHVNEGTVPNRKSIGVKAIEEERRMLYVAMTRAKDKLYISYVEGKGNRKEIPSRFLYSLIK